MPRTRSARSGLRLLVVTAGLLATAGVGLVPAAITPAGAAPATACQAPDQQSTPSIGTDQSGYVTQLQPQRAWAVARGAGVTVALLDTGVSPALAGAGGALAGRLLDGGNLAGDPVTTALLDCDGRGTADAGLIAAADQPNRLPGLAPDATLLAVRVQADAETAPTPGAVAAGITAAVSRHAAVVVIAAPCAASAELAGAVAAAVRAGVVIVAAVGDESRSTTSYPAGYAGVIGATAAPGSGTSTGVSGAFVDLAAPASGLAGWAVSGSGYRVSLSGSGPAAALIGGAAALVRAAHPTVAPGGVEALLEQSASHPAAALPDGGQGWGTVNPYAAVVEPLTATSPPTPAATRAPAVTLPPRDNPHHRYVGALIACGLLAVAVAAVLAVAAVRRARRRGWHAGPDQTGRPSGSGSQRSPATSNQVTRS